MSSLWKSNDVSAWEAALSNTNQARIIITRKRKDFQSLDEAYERLSGTILGRKSPYLTQAELVTLVDWKLNRGKWRPRLLDYAKAHTDDDVMRASSNAFRDFESSLASGNGVTAALTALCSLKGVGPATASAILALVSPHFCPFMSDESLNMTATPRDYTAKSYLILRSKLIAKAKELSKSGKEWTAVMVEMALWASCFIEDDGDSKEKEMPATKKTKRC